MILGLLLISAVLILALNLHAETTPSIVIRKDGSTTHNYVPPTTRAARYQSPMTTPPFEWSRRYDLHQTQASLAPKYGQVSLQWTTPGGDRPWRGSEEAANLHGPSARESYIVTPMLSYDFPNAGMSRDVNVRTLSSSETAAGFQELTFSRSDGVQGLGYKDLVSPDSLGVPNPVLMNPYITGK